MDLILKLREKLVSKDRKCVSVGVTNRKYVSNCCKDRKCVSDCCKNRKCVSDGVKDRKCVSDCVKDRKCVSAFQIKARRQQLQVKDGVLDKLDTFINSIIRSLPEDLQTVLNTH